MTGSRLQLSSLMGLQPVVGGRFYGMGNVTFALFATATILLCIAVADHFVRAGRRRGRGASPSPRSAWPRSSSTASRPGAATSAARPRCCPAWPTSCWPSLGVRLTWRAGPGDRRRHRSLFLLVIGFVDWLRPPESRSHLGRFVQTAIDGGAATIILRKARQNWDILSGSTLTLLVPIGLVFVVYILARPTSWGSRALHRAYERAPLLRPGLISLLVLFLIGFAANDSGTAIPAVGATLALPLVIAIERADAAGRDAAARRDHARHASHATTAQTSQPGVRRHGAPHPQRERLDPGAHRHHPARHVGQGHHDPARGSRRVQRGSPRAPAGSPR